MRSKPVHVAGRPLGAPAALRGGPSALQLLKSLAWLDVLLIENWKNAITTIPRS